MAGVGKGGHDTRPPRPRKDQQIASSFASRGAFFFLAFRSQVVLLPNMKRHVHLKKGLEVKELVLVKGNREIIIG